MRHAARIRQRVRSVPHAEQLATDSRWTRRTTSVAPPRAGAPIFCKMIAYLFNMSLATSTVPRRWKEAKIRPLYSKYQHQSNTLTTNLITPIMSRVMERTMVRTFLYPTFLESRPVGSRSVKADVRNYVSTAWRGFVTASDIQRIDAFLRRR